MRHKRVYPLQTIDHGILALLISGLLILLAFFPVSTGMAQDLESIWTPGVNLSRSGLSQSPAAVIDNDGITHVFWYDQLEGNRYAQSEDGQNWSLPVNLELPFEDNLPRLFVDPENNVYAFWIDAVSMLNVARVSVSEIGNENFWSPPLTLARNVVSYDVILDEAGVIHLTYQTNYFLIDKPAGVYYVQREPGNKGWGTHHPVYTSLYFRALSVEGGANVSIASISSTVDAEVPTSIVYVAWDEPALQRVLTSRSIDGGETWEPLQLIDKADVAIGSAPPGGVKITAWRDELMVLWKKDAEGTNCSINFRLTTRDSNQWTPVQTFVSDLSACPEFSGFLGFSDDFLFWQGILNGQVYLAVWNGQQWSPLRPQTDLNGVEDPLTLRALTTACHQLVFRPETSRVGAVFCDENGNQDIWFSSMDLRQVDDWFSQSTAWQMPVELNIIGNKHGSLNLVTGLDGSFYALWLQTSQVSGAGSQGSRLFDSVMLSTWSSERWSQSSTAIRPEARVFDMSAAINEKNELMVVLQEDNQGQLYFIRAQAERAFSPSDWSEPVQLPRPAGLSSDPVILAGAGEEVVVVFAVPHNEGRGIYASRSTDEGRTWNDTVQVFDAQAAGWEMVQEPALIRDGYGRIHAFWKHGSLLHQEEGFGAGYAFSDNGGVTWSQPDLSIEAPVSWVGISGAGNGSLLRVWREMKGDFSLIVSQVSADNGGTWQPPLSIATSGDVLGDPDLVPDLYGRIHLLQMSRNSLGSVVMLHWIWDDGEWTPGENLTLFIENVQGIGELAGGISNELQAAVLYSVDIIINNSESRQVLFGVVGQTSAGSIDRSEEVPETNATENEQATVPTATSEAQTLETAEPTQVSATLDLTDDQSTGKSGESNQWTGLLYGAGLAAFLVVVVLGIRAYQSRWK